MGQRGKPLAVTVGDPGGIGPEIVLAAWQARKASDLSPFYVLADPQMLSSRAAHLGWDVPMRQAVPGDATDAFADALPVVALGNRFTDRLGGSAPANAAGIVEAIDRAVEDTLAGQASAVVTGPIAKKSLYDAGFAFPGHTEYLAHLAHRHTGKEAFPVMMLAGPDLRAVPVTIHVPLATVPTLLTTDLIVTTARIAARDLAARFGLKAPKLAISGLNPHAGEGGAMGKEDLDVVAPAVALLQAEGIDAIGPLPADTLFHARARASYDAAICMYHDQALIPAKTLAFDEAVNVTLGLPFIRTSPDHGTAFDLAGSGTARPDSFIAALKLAHLLATNEAKR